MRNCGEIISREIEVKKVLRKDLAQYLGQAPQNITKILSKDSIDAAMLEKICQYLSLDPASFFDYRPGLPGSGVNTGDIEQHVMMGSASVNFKDGERELMERLLSEKDARITNLERTVEILTSLLESKNNHVIVTGESADV